MREAPTPEACVGGACYLLDMPNLTLQKQIDAVFDNAEKPPKTEDQLRKIMEGIEMKTPMDRFNAALKGLDMKSPMDRFAEQLNAYGKNNENAIDRIMKGFEGFGKATAHLTPALDNWTRINDQMDRQFGRDRVSDLLEKYRDMPPLPPPAPREVIVRELPADFKIPQPPPPGPPEAERVCEAVRQTIADFQLTIDDDEEVATLIFAAQMTIAVEEVECCDPMIAFHGRAQDGDRCVVTVHHTQATVVCKASSPPLPDQTPVRFRN